MATAYPPLIIPLSVALLRSIAEGVLDAVFPPVGDHDEQVPLASAEGGTIEAIGKYQLISSPPINHYTIVPITHVSRPIFPCESIGTIFKILRVHLHGVVGQIQ